MFYLHCIAFLIECVKNLKTYSEFALFKFFESPWFVKYEEFYFKMIL